MIARIIYGGSFDPPTKAHISLAEQLSKRFSEVITVPSYISPFKPDVQPAPTDVRLKMINAAFSAIPNLTISGYELDKKGTSYSYMTARNMAEEGVRLYFALGSEGLSTLDKWAKPDILKKYVTFYIVERPYFPIDEDMLKKQRKLFDIEVADFNGQEGSSSLLRLCVAFNRQSDVVIPSVSDIIKKEGLYRDYVYITQSYPRFNMKVSRAEHIFRTAKMAILLAKRYGEDVNRAVKTMLFHDIGKYVDYTSLLQMGIPVKDEVKILPESCRHALTGRSIAQYIFNEKDEGILDAVETHTLAAEHMTLLQKIAYVSDYIEEGRDFEGLEQLRKTAFSDLDLCVEKVLENTIDYLSKNGMEIYPTTVKAYEYYKNLSAGELNDREFRKV